MRRICVMTSRILTSDRFQMKWTLRRGRTGQELLRVVISNVVVTSEDWRVPSINITIHLRSHPFGNGQR